MLSNFKIGQLFKHKLVHIVNKHTSSQRQIREEDDWWIVEISVYLVLYFDYVRKKTIVIKNKIIPLTRHCRQDRFFFVHTH